MIFLVIDTCSHTGSVAIAKGTPDEMRILASQELAGKTFSLHLVTKIEESLAQASTSLSDLDAVAVVNGPGSFTGVRIGVSTAKALAEVAKKPLIALSRLEVLSHIAGTKVAALDAGRGEAYVRAAIPAAQEVLLNQHEMMDFAAGKGPIAICEESLSAPLSGADAVRVRPPLAEDAVSLAVERFLSGSFEDVAFLDGNYLRRSDAEIFSKPKLDAALQR